MEDFSFVAAAVKVGVVRTRQDSSRGSTEWA